MLVSDLQGVPLACRVESVYSLGFTAKACQPLEQDHAQVDTSMGQLLKGHNTWFICQINKTQQTFPIRGAEHKKIIIQGDPLDLQSQP